ncbi:hypothetical protein PPE03_12720 [Pseudoalteromonas peptidolytica]|nr:hypothetical protein PPE03_12720 [Pseudoalteromonas peptidolytica]
MQDELEVQLMLYGAHPLLLTVKDGVIEGARKYDSGNKISFHLNDANFQFQEAVFQSRQVSRKGASALVAFGTPSIKAAISNSNPDVKVFFGASSDPVSIGVANSNDPDLWKEKGFDGKDNVYGLVTNFDYVGMASLISNVLPKKESNEECVRIGYPMSDGEPNSVLAYDKLKFQLEKEGFCLISSAVSSPVDVPLAIRSLISKGVSAIQVGPDNTVSGSIGAVVSIAHNANLPVFTSDSASISKGADAAYAVDFYMLGIALGEKVAQVVLDKEVNEESRIDIFSNSKLYISKQFLSSHLNSDQAGLLKGMGLEEGSIILVDKAK